MSAPYPALLAASAVPSRADRASGALLQGESECARLGLDFAETFRRQFVLSETAVRAPESWPSHRIDGWTLRHCPNLPCARLTDPKGALRAVVLGIAVTEAGETLADAMVPDAEAPTLERRLEGLAGRYVVILRAASGLRVYPDPANSLSTFYAPRARRIATSLALCLDRPIQPHPTMPLGSMGAGVRRYYFFGDTPDAETRRMKGNHFLDLQDFSEHRHWPRDDDDFSVPEKDSAVLESMIHRQRQIIDAITASHRTGLPLTGGMDSRWLLACTGQDARDRLATVFTHTQNLASFADTMIAASLCERLGIPHTAVTCRVPGGHDPAWLERMTRMVALRTGGQYEANANVISAAEAAPQACDVLMRGGQVELTRASKWRAKWGDDPETPVDPLQGVRAMASPLKLEEGWAEEQAPGYARWMSTLPAGMRGRAPDLAHCELWTPATIHLGYTAFQSHFMVNPFNDRALIRGASRLSYRMRRRCRPQTYLMRAALPEVRDIPYRTRDLMKALSKGRIATLTGRSWR